MLTRRLSRTVAFILALQLITVSAQPGITLTTDPTADWADPNVLRPCGGLCNRWAAFVMFLRGDGNLVLYDLGGSRRRFLWSPGVFAADPNRIVVLANTGELFLLNGDRSVAWRSGVRGPIGDVYTAFLTHTGDFVIVDSQNLLLWNSGSHFSQLSGFSLTKRLPNVGLDGVEQRIGCSGWNCEDL